MVRRSPLALAYHGVRAVPLREDPMRLFCAPDQVRRDIRVLRAWGYELVTFGELAARIAGGAGSGCAALTFDDGLADNLETLVPLLRSERAAATVFVVSGWLGHRHPDAGWAPILDGEGLRALHAAGIEIGAHTITHPDLTTLPGPAAEAELAGSRSALEAMLDAPVTVAAYPYGAADATVRDAARRAGLTAACRTSGAGNVADPFDLPREAMGNGASRLGLRLKRGGRHEPLMRVPLMRRARRLSRRLHALDR